MLKALIYTRVSTEEQAENGTSLETQELACLRRAALLGAQVVGIHKDEGISGALLLSRPGIQAALKDLEGGQADVLIVANLSRFSRDAEHQQQMKKRIEKAGGRLVLCDMEVSDTPEGDLQFGIMGQFAQYEKAVIRDRTMKGRVRRAEQGLQPARGQSPLGYHIVTKEDVLRGEYAPELLGRYVVIETEARIVRELYQRCQAGQSLRQLAKWLYEAGVETQRGGKYWHASSVRGLLQNPVYKGMPMFGRFQWRTDESRIQRNLKPEFSRRAPEGEAIVMECEALVDALLWQRCQERLTENAQRLSGPQDRKYLLVGLLRCPVCRRAMRVTKPKRYAFYYYHCRENRPSQSISGEVCLQTTHRGDVVETLLLRDLRFLSRQPERFADALATYERQRRLQEQGGASGEIERLQAELTEIEKQEAATARAQVDALMKGRGTEVYDRLLSDLDAKRKPICARIATLSAAQQTPPAMDCRTEAEKVAEVLRRVEEVLSASEEEVSNAEKNGILSTVIQAVYPEGEGYTLELRQLSSIETVACVRTH